MPAAGPLLSDHNLDGARTVPVSKANSGHAVFLSNRLIASVTDVWHHIGGGRTN
jgi:hypothetical protein